MPGRAVEVVLPCAKSRSPVVCSCDIAYSCWAELSQLVGELIWYQSVLFIFYQRGLQNSSGLNSIVGAFFSCLLSLSFCNKSKCFFFLDKFRNCYHVACSLWHAIELGTNGCTMIYLIPLDLWNATPPSFFSMFQPPHSYRPV